MNNIHTSGELCTKNHTLLETIIQIRKKPLIIIFARKSLEKNESKKRDFWLYVVQLSRLHGSVLFG